MGDAIRKGKSAKAGHEILKGAEEKLLSLHQVQERRRSMRQQIEAAAKNEMVLKECIDECAKEEWQQEALYAQKLLERLVVEQEAVAKEHKDYLDKLWDAVVSGDTDAIRSARDKAKKAG